MNFAYQRYIQPDFHLISWSSSPTQIFVDLHKVHIKKLKATIAELGKYKDVYMIIGKYKDDFLIIGKNKDDYMIIGTYKDDYLIIGK